MRRYFQQVCVGDTSEDQTRSRTSQSFLHHSIFWAETTQVQTDKGTEFLNRQFQKFLRDNNIHFFTVNSGLKASVIERFNRTFNNKMYKYFTAKNILSYIDVLPQLVSSYNNTYHRSIKMKPTQVTKANESKVWDTLYSGDVQKQVRFKFQVGDRVRISKVK